MKIETLTTLTLNPFWLSEIIGNFNEGYGNNAPFELTYLVIPLILRENTRVKLSLLNINSTIYSAFLDSKEKRVIITALQRHVEFYKKNVMPSLAVYANKGNVLSGEITNMKPYKFNTEKNLEVRKYLKAAYYLGVIFRKESSKNCFAKLGVFEL